MITDHTYYLAAEKQVRGAKPELAAFLYAIYMRHLAKEEAKLPEEVIVESKCPTCNQTRRQNTATHKPTTYNDGASFCTKNGKPSVIVCYNGKGVEMKVITEDIFA
jgi:hypothetical protein